MDMTMDEYQVAALRTEPTYKEENHRLLNGALGLAGEAGEVADHAKKWYFQGHALDPSAVMKELGDVMWYVALCADFIGVTLGEIAQANIVKLETRYPDGFDPERSKNRED